MSADRRRRSRPPMLALDEAIERVLGARCARPAARPRRDGLDLRRARPRAGRRRALAARRAAGDNSEMDGYALRAADVPARRHACCRSASASRPARSAQPLQPGTRGAHLHRRAGAGRRRRGRDAGAVRGASTAACASTPCRAPGQWIRRRGEDVAARRASCWRAGMRLTPQALGWRRRSARRRCGSRAGRASRCSPPATNS